MLGMAPVALAQQGGAAAAGQPITTPAPPPPAGQPADPNDGRPIREVRLIHPVPDHPGQTEPVPARLAQLMRNQIRSLEGRPFDRAVVTEDITRLNRLGRFRSIETQLQPLQDGSVALTFLVVEQPTIQDVQVVGNREMSDQEILQAVSLLAGTPIDRFQIDRNARAIEELYHAKGFSRVRVEIDEKELAESQIVVFRVIEGDRVRVTGVRFEGNKAFSAKELRSAIKTTEYIPILDKAPLDQDVLNDDVSALVSYYRDRGYLDARVGREIQQSPNGREAIVTFIVDEGPLYNLRSVQVLYRNSDAVRQYKEEVLKDAQADVRYLTPEQMRRIGRRSFSDEQIAGLMVIKPGDVFSEDKLRKSEQALTAAYGKLGSVLSTGRGPLTALIEHQEVRDEHAPQVDLLLFITEGALTTTGEPKVIGNDLTKQQVILREVQVKPGRPLDAEALKESARRLEQLRLFEPASVRLTIQDPTPEQQRAAEETGEAIERDVLVEVRETNTGQFNIGAAVSSDGGLVGQISVVQRNFDIAAPPGSWGDLISGHAFRGAGQTASLDLQPGTLQQTYSISLTDPYLLESDYSGSFAAFYRTREFDQYTEQRFGFRPGIARRFGSVWTGTLATRAEWVKPQDIDPTAPVDYFDVQDQKLISGVGLDFIRTTVDDRYRPSRGNRLELGAEEVFGDFNFTKLKVGYTTFFNVYESFLGYKTILKLNSEAQYIPQGQGSAPFYERYYLGGQSFRGFAYRGVSPRGIRNDTGTLGDDPIGGAFEFFLGAEINQPIYKDIFSVVAFVDTGTVETRPGFDHYRVSVGTGIRFYIRQLSPVPLAFDFGFPVLKQDGDHERVFTFSLDVPLQ